MAIVLAALGVVSASTARRAPDLVGRRPRRHRVAAVPLSVAQRWGSGSRARSITSRYQAALAFGVRASVS